MLALGREGGTGIGSARDVYVIGSPPLSVTRSEYLEQVRRIAPPDPPGMMGHDAALAAFPAQVRRESQEAAPATYGIWDSMRGEFDELRRAIEQALVLPEGDAPEAGTADTNLTFESFEVRPGMVTFSVSLRPSHQRVLLRVGSNAYLSAPERERFIEEVELAQEVSSHLRVARILGGGFTSLGYPFVMQLIDGEAVAVRRPLTVAEVIDIGRKLADALDYAHNMGTSFGVIEPSNILMTANGDPVLSFPNLPMFVPLGDGITAAALDVYGLCATLLSMLPRPQDSPRRTDSGSASLEAQVRELLGSGMQTEPALQPSAPVLRERFYELMRKAAGIWDNTEISRRIRIPGKGGSFAAEILVHTGDLFSEPSDVVVSFSDTFDTDTDTTTNPGRVIISPSSLQGQLISRIYDGDIEALDRDLDDALASMPVNRIESREKKRLGKLRRYGIGTVAVLERSDRKIFAVAVSRMGNDLIARSSYEFLDESLRNLWEEIRRQNCTSVAMPIIGSGLARVDVSPYNLYDLISSSFRMHTQIKRICPELRITIHSSDRETVRRIDAALSTQSLTE